ncbi:hypothetical protein GUJ93_ZPchr0011g27517 [Zizania palustris]|uniref:F-box domain-containing protein n=1 Tax=Zizania palustris TaxID=103762 RepID=A0A8J5WL31_ZIZPA|nr:hypothetical protein GUJ93_ZPchr0011g27517 [Zizania palustris]
MAPPPPPPELAGLEVLEGLALDTVIAKAGARSAAMLACASARLRAVVADDALWRRFCADDLGLDLPVDPEGRPLSSFKVGARSNSSLPPPFSVYFLRPKESVNQEANPSAYGLACWSVWFVSDLVPCVWKFG